MQNPKNKKVPSAKLQMTLLYTDYYARYCSGSDTLHLHYIITAVARQCTAKKNARQCTAKKKYLSE